MSPVIAVSLFLSSLSLQNVSYTPKARPVTLFFTLFLVFFGPKYWENDLLGLGLLKISGAFW